MIVRKRYASPYRRYKYFHITSDDLKSKKAFIACIEDKSKHWRDGEYFLKEEDGCVLARFNIKEGKLVKLHETSPATDQRYRCWDCFKK
jgi:hypothetical protein